MDETTRRATETQGAPITSSGVTPTGGTRAGGYADRVVPEAAGGDRLHDSSFEDTPGSPAVDEGATDRPGEGTRGMADVSLSGDDTVPSAPGS